MFELKYDSNMYQTVLLDDGEVKDLETLEGKTITSIQRRRNGNTIEIEVREPSYKLTGLARAKRLAEINLELLELGINPPVTFEFEGTEINNPFTDEMDSFTVDPIEHYGEAFLESEFMNG